MLRLQNGQFDDPNRLFHSMAESFCCSLNNMTDVKELIPEFYDTSLRPVGEFLVNKENLMFGSRQDGTVAGDVVLPPWANG